MSYISEEAMAFEQEKAERLARESKPARKLNRCAWCLCMFIGEDEDYYEPERAYFHSEACHAAFIRHCEKDD